MALFGNKQAKSETKDLATNTPATVSQALPTDYDPSIIIKHPRLTEKTVNLGEQNVYTFVVRRDATKYDVQAAIKALYQVTPVKVNIVNQQPAKRLVGSRNRLKHVPGMKKAYVYLAAGDTINLV